MSWMEARGGGSLSVVVASKRRRAVAHDKRARRRRGQLFSIVDGNLNEGGGRRGPGLVDLLPQMSSRKRGVTVGTCQGERGGLAWPMNKGWGSAWSEWFFGCHRDGKLVVEMGISLVVGSTGLGSRR